jgi:hypothetical protein
MTKKKENKLGMYRTTGDVLTNNAPIFAGVPMMVTQHQNLLDSISLIDSLAQAQSAVTTGITIDKKNFQTQMVTFALRVAGALRAHASASGNATLLKVAEMNPSSFSRARDDVRDDLAQEIWDKATPIVAQLADAGVTPATLSALKTRIQAYRLALAKPQVARAERTSHTTLLEEEFARAETIATERLDGLMLQFQESNAGFYLAYIDARKVIDTGSQKKGDAPPPPPKL